MRLFPVFLTHRIPVINLAIACTLGLAGCGGESSQTLLSQAQTSLKAGDRKAATIQLKNAIQKDEHNAEARFQLAKILIQQGDYPTAEKELRRARAAGLSADLVNPLMARALLGLGEFQRVLDEIPVPAAGRPTEAVFLVARANAQLGLKQIDEARKSLERAILIAPHDADAHLTWARMSAKEGKAGDAFQQIDTALKSSPDKLDAWLFKADLLRANGKPKEAVTAYQTALKIDPQHLGAHLGLAEIAIAENRLADAKTQVAIVLKTAPGNLLGHYTQALIDYREQKFTAARDHLAGVLKAAPKYLPALLLNGSIEFALGNLQTAEAQLNKVVKSAPNNVYASRLLATVQLKLGRVDEASRTLAPALAAAPQDTGVQVVAGEIALAKKAFAEAEKHFEMASKMSPHNAAIRTELGLTRLAQGDHRAMADLQTAAGMEGGGSRPDTFIILNQLKNRQFDAALISIAALEKKQPNGPLIWNYRGAAYLGKQDAVRARTSFNQALKLDPGFFPAASNLAQLDLQDNQPAAARKHFEDILKAKPAHLNAMLALADVSLRSNDEKNHISWLEKAAATHPEAALPRVALGRYFLAKGDKSKALDAARQAVTAQPDNAAALDLLGTTQLALGDSTNALASYHKLVQGQPNQAAPLLRLASAQWATKDLNGTRKTLLNALQLQPNQPDAVRMLGRVEIQSGRFDEAQKLARQTQQQKPNSAIGFILEGETAFARKDYLTALSAFERAHKLEPASALLLSQLQVLNALHRDEEGEKRLLVWLAAHPQDASTRPALAESLGAHKRYAAAVEHYLILDKTHPGSLAVLNNLAWALHESGDKRAAGFAEQALRLAPENSAVLDTYGWILAQTGQTEKGLASLRKALAKNPGNAEIQYHLAAALFKGGERVRAKGELERLLASGVSFPQAAEARALLNQIANAP
jgi:putative PEP-CTERM system TPR-repeat lipoprotein